MTAVMVDLVGPELSAEEREMLEHPAVGGVIYFTRNFHDVEQMAELVRQTRAAARNPLILAVDHEGGRVQRFREGFSAIPAMGRIGQLAPDQSTAEQWATDLAWLMASEVQALDIDISFAPVLDINGVSEVIGDRAFGEHANAIVPLAQAFIKGMHQAGMKATGKHFPGHGSVQADSHFAVPIDEREWESIAAIDLPPFAELAALMDAVMPAHVIYPKLCPHPAGFSPFWLQQVLREQLEFRGIIFSDDLAMAGAHVAGSMPERAFAALHAGCDMVLCCNDPGGAHSVLSAVQKQVEQGTWGGDKVYRQLAKAASLPLSTLRNHPRWHQAQRVLAEFN